QGKCRFDHAPGGAIHTAVARSGHPSIPFDTMDRICAFLRLFNVGVTYLLFKKDTNNRPVGYPRPQPIENDAALVDIDLPQPEAKGRDLLVQVRAVSVNPVDT